jgi:gliding motility-associated-like protein
VVPSPEIVNLIDLSRCDDDSPNGFASFDLTINTPEALGSQDATQVVVTYHETQADAELGTNAIAVPSNYTNITNPQTIYVRIFDTLTGCVDLFDSAGDPNNTFTLTVEALPEVFIPTALEVCDDDYNQNPFPQVTFDLTVKEPEIVGQAVVPASFAFTYFASQSDLDDGIAIADPTAYVNEAQPQTIYITVVDTDTENSCLSEVQMTINVLPLPSPSTTDPDTLRLTGCDDDNDGVAVNPFDLTFSGNFIAGSENVSLSYYLSESGAISEDPDELIADPTAYINDPALNETDENGLPTNIQIIYVRVDSGIAGNFCFVIVPFELVVFPNPELNPLGDPFAYTLCADDETDPNTATLFSTEDITNNLWNLNGGSPDVIIPLLDPNTTPAQDLADFNVTYHNAEQDAEDGINAISPGYLASDGEILFIRVTNITSECYNTGNIGQVQIIIQPRPDIAPDNPLDLVACADDFTNGIATVDLTQYDELINPGSPANTQVVYYEGQMNYDNGIAIDDPVNYTTLQTPTSIIAEVINTLTGCESSRTLAFDIIINPLIGDISAFDGILLCVDAEGDPIFNEVSPPVIDTGLSENDFSFAWALDGVPIPDTTASITPLLPGVYTVVVTNNFTGCQATSSAEVIANQAIGFNVDVITPAFSTTHVAEVNNITGNGNFEFQLDNGPWIPLAPGQTTLTFTNISPGTHTITGRDQGGCGEVTIEFMVIDYPPFFTPNQDGFNETWNITALDEDLQATIYIFDRYGKLLKQISPRSEGWDGTYNGKAMPSQDYWFRVEFVEPTTGAKSEFKGHFTLKR